MEKVQLSFNCRTAGERVIERSTLVNIRVDTVDEATELYNELMAKLGKDAVISEHEYLPQIPTHVPVRLPAPSFRNEPVRVNQEQESEYTPRCSRCNVPMRKMQSKFKPNTAWWGCPNWRVNGCLEKMPA
jgi:hypothetical protein